MVWLLQFLIKTKIIKFILKGNRSICIVLLKIRKLATTNNNSPFVKFQTCSQCPWKKTSGRLTNDNNLFVTSSSRSWNAIYDRQAVNTGRAIPKYNWVPEDTCLFNAIHATHFLSRQSRFKLIQNMKLNCNLLTKLWKQSLWFHRDGVATNLRCQVTGSTPC